MLCGACRGGATAAFDRLNTYFLISNMPIVSSQYWNMGARFNSGRGPAGSGGAAGYADAGGEYGVDAAVH
ncbi:hypothetical protein [Methanocorpusculum vombati]|uniref:Uncharacterized protein n=1 Tax=Methanocorpusculum vombati TaxID=3002864 RepID=A0ABT4IJG7_9EURY|nr:hypothetical protein [Methanocorpusculum vombati]MCZ0861706.1 hypothetical protein [Methanocorpusculum vombati]MDE2545611.1 hypothetical protein [Methanocorpusculum sp.]